MLARRHPPNSNTHQPNQLYVHRCRVPPSILFNPQPDHYFLFSCRHQLNNSNTAVVEPYCRIIGGPLLHPLISTTNPTYRVFSNTSPICNATCSEVRPFVIQPDLDGVFTPPSADISNTINSYPLVRSRTRVFWRLMLFSGMI